MPACVLLIIEQELILLSYEKIYAGVIDVRQFGEVRTNTNGGIMPQVFLLAGAEWPSPLRGSVSLDGFIPMLRIGPSRLEPAYPQIRTLP